MCETKKYRNRTKEALRVKIRLAGWNEQFIDWVLGTLDKASMKHWMDWDVKTINAVMLKRWYKYVGEGSHIWNGKR